MTLPTLTERTVQQTQHWLKEIRDELALSSEDAALQALRGVLHQLRDRMTPDEAVDLSAQLPTLVRGVFFEGWKPTQTPEKERSRDEFVARVGERLHDHPEIDPDAATRVVFALLDRELDSGEIDEVIHMMTEPLKHLWPDHARERAEARL